jgi:hypothetical protein
MNAVLQTPRAKFTRPDATGRTRPNAARESRSARRAQQCWSVRHRFGVGFELRRQTEPLRRALDRYLRSVPRFLRARSATILSAIMAATSTAITLSRRTLRTTIGLAHFFLHR